MAKKSANVATTVTVAHKDVKIDVEPGMYRKAGTRRAGIAHLTVVQGSEGPVLGYVNRRMEAREVSAAEWIRNFNAGLNTRFEVEAVEAQAEEAATVDA